MSLAINTNIAALTARNNLATNGAALKGSIEKLSSGLRINRASDDAAGLAVSEKMRSQIRSMNQAVRNANDGISVAQRAEGALVEVSNILVRMRELGQESSNGSLSNSDRTALNDEFVALKSEIDRISSVTDFNGQILLNGSISGSGSALSFQIGTDSGSNNAISLQISAMSAGAIGVTTSIEIGSGATAAMAALTAIDSAIAVVTTTRGKIGAVQNRLQSTIANLAVGIQNLSAAESQIRDADFALETATFTRNQILQNAGVSVLAQANTLPQAALQLLR